MTKLPQILVSIRPKWADLILTGEKTLEYRRNMSLKALLLARRMWIYASKPVGKVIGCASIRIWEGTCVFDMQGNNGCLSRAEYDGYFKGAERHYGIVIKDFAVLARPILLAEIGIAHAPQSWMYMPESALEMIGETIGGCK